ncbi:hypothetical protein JKY72_01285 [Candidatus Gracilibacteria bacterium]|nr:hypothetical protein [Candidatus Gracilibacteria bacterium]
MDFSQKALLDQISPVIAGKKYSLPIPQEDYLQRQKKRLAFRNEKTLYKRKCDKCDKIAVGTYAPDAPFVVYCQDCFWGDDWNALDYGRDFDFERPFFEQFQELMKEVPRLCVVNKQSENSEYCNFSFANKNCYLLFGSHYEEDCMYGRYSTKNKDCVDYFWCYDCELCYECQISANCYKSVGLDHCENCDECLFSMDLKSCKDCIFCFGLRNKKFCIFNEQKTEKEYRDYVEKLQLGSAKQWKEILKGWNDFKREKAIFRAQYQVNCESCEGTEHRNSKNLQNAYACTDCESCINAFQHDNTHFSIDNSHTGYDKCELCNECIGINGAYHNIVCDSCWHCSDVYYANLCFSSKNLFGCIGLNQAEYCVFNKKYSPEEYEDLVARIIESMWDEWGQFFPMEISPFPYADTVAQEIFPESEDVREVADAGGDVLHCEVTGQPYRIMPVEAQFYEKMGLPQPLRCPDQRIKDRIDMSGFLKSYERKCGKCGEGCQTIYAEDRAKNVYCEKCYLQEVY